MYFSLVLYFRIFLINTWSVTVTQPCMATQKHAMAGTGAALPMTACTPRVLAVLVTLLLAAAAIQPQAYAAVALVVRSPPPSTRQRRCCRAPLRLKNDDVANPPRRNVLMIAIDDLRAEFGVSFGSPEVLTPHIDQLAKSSVIFTRNYCQAATCGISRSSLLTGRRPDTTRVLTNSGCPFRTGPHHAEWVSLPRHFRNQAFTTQGTLSRSCCCEHVGLFVRKSLMFAT